MANATVPRPQKVTMACLTAGVASAIALISIITTLSSWGSIEIREGVEDALKVAPLDGALTVDEALSWLRIILMIGGAMCAAGIVLAIWTAKRHRGARVGLTVLAALSSLAFAVAGTAGIVPAVLCALVIVLLWGGESRAWFAGDAVAATPPRPSAPPPRQVAPPSPSRPESPSQPPAASPPPVQVPVRGPQTGEIADQPAPATRPYAAGPGPVSQAYGQPYTQPTGQPTPTRQPQPPYGHAGWPPYGPPAVLDRPRPLRTAVLAALVGSCVAAIQALLYGLPYLTDRDRYLEDVVEPALRETSDILGQTSPITAEQLGLMTFGIYVGLVLLAVLVAVSAVAMLSGKPAARVVFTVAAGFGIAGSLFLVPLGLISLAALVGSVVLAWRREVSAWFRTGR